MSKEHLDLICSASCQYKLPCLAGKLRMAAICPGCSRLFIGLPHVDEPIRVYLPCQVPSDQCSRLWRIRYKISICTRIQVKTLIVYCDRCWEEEISR